MKNYQQNIVNIFKGLFLILLVVLGFSAYRINQNYTQAPNAGAINLVPTPIALFETTLSNSITSSATTFTLTSATDKDGTTLATSTYAFIIDEGTASEEFVVAECTATACTNAKRGVSVLDGTTEVTALKKAHRRGASVKITDGPQLLILSRLASGNIGYENALKYSGVSTTTLGLDGNNIASVAYANALSFGAVAGASTSTAGFVEMATTAEINAGTSLGGSGARLAIGPAELFAANPISVFASYFVSTSAGAGDASKGVKLNSSGLIDNSMINSVPVVRTYLNAASPATWTKPAGLKYVVVEVQAGGGAGGNTTNNGHGAGGGGGGGYSRKQIAAASLGATETVTIGAGGTTTGGSGAAGGNGGSSSFGTHATATGGSGGSAGGNTSAGGAGGAGSSGDVNRPGANGAGGGSTDVSNGSSGGSGGSSALGSGAGGNITNGSSVSGSAGAVYGGGGSGAMSGSASSDITGGAGAAGIVIVTEFY